MRLTPEEEALVLPPGTEGTSLASFTGGANFASGPGGDKFNLLPGGAVILMPREPVLRLGSARSSAVAALLSSGSIAPETALLSSGSVGQKTALASSGSVACSVVPCAVVVHHFSGGWVRLVGGLGWFRLYLGPL